MLPMMRPSLLQPPPTAGRLVVAGGTSATGLAGQILTSLDDGVTWSLRTTAGAPGGAGWTAGVWTGSQFCIVGGTLIETAPDGATWTSRTSVNTNSGGSKVTVYGVAWGASLLAAATAFTGSPKNALHETSADGSSWTSRSSSGSIAQLCVRFVNSLFVSVGEQFTGLYSAAGSSWTVISGMGVSGSENANGIAYGASLYVVVGGGAGTGRIRTSPDLATWTTRTSGVVYSLRDVAFGNSLFVAVGDASTILTSTDGTTWTARTSAVSASLYGVIWNGAVWIVVGAGGKIQTSPDGITWTARTSGVTGGFQFVC